MLSELHSNSARILENLTTAVLLVQEPLQLQFLNPAAEALLDTSAARSVDQDFTELFSNSDDVVPQMHEAMRLSQGFTRRELTLCLNDQSKVTVDFMVTPITAEDGGNALLIELQPLDRLLRISREEGILSSQNNTRALIRGIAHEVKNPLGGLRGAAQLLARELPDPALQDYTNIIIEEADRLRNLVDDMLGPRQEPRLNELNIHEVLERVRHLAEAEYGKEVTVKRDYDPSIPNFLADREQLIQATLNIVRNAVQAVSGQKDAQIVLRTRTQRQLTIGTTRHRLVCRIEIIDNGPGIADDLLGSIFFPMVSGRANGTGLGLSISQSIVNRHKGLIECESHPGRTVFAISLPLECIQ